MSSSQTIVFPGPPKEPKNYIDTDDIARQVLDILARHPDAPKITISVSDAFKQKSFLGANTTPGPNGTYVPLDELARNLSPNRSAFYLQLESVLKGAEGEETKLTSPTLLIFVSRLEDGKISTTPVVPLSSPGFNPVSLVFENTPKVIAGADGTVTDIDLQNGTVFKIGPSLEALDRVCAYPRP